jgi:hypothetical protein
MSLDFGFLLTYILKENILFFRVFITINNIKNNDLVTPKDCCKKGHIDVTGGYFTLV